MILQTDPTLPAEVRRYGCYLLSICFLANKWGGQTVTPADIVWLWRLGVLVDWITAECYIKAPVRIFGTMECLVEYNDQHMPPTYNLIDDEIEILCFKRDDRHYAHFVAGDGLGHVAYDPMGNSSSVRKGKLISKRVFRRV